MNSRLLVSSVILFDDCKEIKLKGDSECFIDILTDSVEIMYLHYHVDYYNNNNKSLK